MIILVLLYVTRFRARNKSNEIDFKIRNYPVVQNYEKKDWHDWKFIEYEASRTGPGEQGRPYELTDPKEIELNEKLFKVEGNFVIVSDKISVNRSVPDTRLPE